jgi:hypothetical protein
MWLDAPKPRQEARASQGGLETWTPALPDPVEYCCWIFVDVAVERWQ